MSKLDISRIYDRIQRHARNLVRFGYDACCHNFNYLNLY